ncbi:MAG: hypothetical protein K2M48_06385 [Clostridiales bacterium]|nr:hypothetical protein [Clostridiales bacterium]
MTDREIEKRLKEEAQNAVPDIYDKILLAAQAEGLLDAQSESSPKQKKKSNSGKPRFKLFAPLASAFAAAAVCLAVVLPITLGGADDPTLPPATYASAEAYALGAVSTVRLLGSETFDRQSFARECAETKKGDGGDAGVKAQIQKFNEYFGALDSFFGDDTVTTTAVENPDAQYPYGIKLTIVGNGLDGSSVTYIMYYDETEKSKTDNGGDSKAKYDMEGVMISDGVEYYLDGERSTESKNDKEKSKLKIRAYADRSDKKTYIEMEQQNSEESDESDGEYVYCVYRNGDLVEQTAVKYESKSKDDKEKSEYGIEFRQGDAKGKYKVKREVKNGVAEIKVEYDLDDDKGEFKITATAGSGYTYTFEDGSTITI